MQWSSFLDRITNAASSTELDAIEQEIFGRKSGAMTTALKALGGMSPEQRKTEGVKLNTEKKNLDDAIAAKRASLQTSALSRIADTDRLDVTLPLPADGEGHLHPIPSFLQQCEETFLRMGFDVAEGPEVEGEDFNFTLLNIPADHPARDMQDTFWLEGDKRDVLRTHTSPVQIRYMQTHKPPFRMICAGKVYRKDSDATHSPMFHQLEGLMIGQDISLAHMKGVMNEAMRELLNTEIVLRFRASYFPFVEPGLEMDMKWTVNGKDRWLEVAGCGMVHPNVLKNCGIDPKKFQGFAFGFGIERLLMIKHKIGDLRSFYDGDPRFLRQF